MQIDCHILTKTLIFFHEPDLVLPACGSQPKTMDYQGHTSPERFHLKADSDGANRDPKVFDGWEAAVTRPGVFFSPPPEKSGDKGHFACLS
jgi:hypothetical protein